MISSDLLAILCCPESHQKLEPADAELIEKLNEQIAAGTLKNRRGQVLQERITSGLVREDKRWLYPVRNDIAIMLVDEALPLT